MIMKSFRMQFRALPILLAIAALPAAGASTPALSRQFEQTVRPFVAKYCIGCHSGQTPAAQFDLKAYTTRDMVTRDYPRWALVMERLTAKEMPPKPVPPPPAEVREHVIAWIQAVRAEEIRKNAGDPGLVLARRLSNAEYNYTIRDLTGQDMQPTREFPVDPANPAGFDNSGESLTMSSALLNKYLQAARAVADHMVLTPDGIGFAPYPMLVESDGPREVSHPAHRELLRPAANRFRGLLSSRLALPKSSRSGQAGRDASRYRGGFESEREVSAHGLGDSARKGRIGSDSQTAGHVARAARAGRR